MARDYKARTTEKKKSSPSIWSGILIGLLIGLAAAVAIAVWVGRSNPFSERHQADENQPAQEKQTQPGKSANQNQIVDPLANATAPSGTDKPRFDFYKILPGNENATTGQDAKQPQTPKADDQYYLQAGAFPNPADADNLKARLALMGFEASIQTIDIPDKGIWHRVRLGPYKMDEANKTRDNLAQNKIQASLVKIKNQNDSTQSKPN
ncbi:MAG: SPOR domain-containing protein [Sulfuriferula sp.]|nr:SPOR domain-containing protein [Sulfuriferula sp.]